MKTLLTLLAILITLSLASTVVEAKDKKKDKDKEKTTLRHVVAFKFKSTATEEQIKKVQDDFKALADKIPQIKKLECGLNNSPEKLNKGCTHAFVLTFKSEKDRDDYLVHPDHKKFGESLSGLLEDVFVIDFVAK